MTPNKKMAQLHNFPNNATWETSPICIPFELLKMPSWQNLFFFKSFLFGVTIQVDFNHPGSPSLQPHHANGMLLPRSPCQWFWRSNIQWISSHKLKPATPKATTIHPPTHPLPPLPLQRNASATPGLCVFFVEDFQASKGFEGNNIILEDEGNTCQGFFVQQVCPMWQMLVGQFRIFRFRGDCNIDIPITKRR